MKNKKVTMTKREKERLSELEEKARDKFIECSDNYNPEEFLNLSEGTEWKQLYNKFLKSI